MAEYQAPLTDMLFLLRELAPLEDTSRLPGHEEMSEDLVKSILEEAGKFASGAISPLNVPGDREGARWRDGDVSTPPGWREAYAQFVEGGWNALSCDPGDGGQGLPRLVSALVEEMWNGANVASQACNQALSWRGICSTSRAGTWRATSDCAESSSSPSCRRPFRKDPARAVARPGKHACGPAAAQCERILRR